MTQAIPVRTEDTTVRPFADWLREQSSGQSHDELSEALYDLVQRVRDTGKKGQLIYTIEIGCLKGDDTTLVASDAIKLKLPEHDRRTTFFFPDRNGNLSREDPRQMRFDFLREVPASATVATVDKTTGEIKEIGNQ